MINLDEALHQDWQLDDPTWQNVIHRYFSESALNQSALVAAGIGRLQTLRLMKHFAAWCKNSDAIIGQARLLKCGFG